MGGLLTNVFANPSKDGIKIKEGEGMIINLSKYPIDINVHKDVAFMQHADFYATIVL